MNFDKFSLENNNNSKIPDFGGFGSFGGFGGFGGFGPATPSTENDDSVEDVDGKVVRNPNKRRKTEVLELSKSYEYRRCFSEVKLLESLKYQELQKDKCYLFLTHGDIDSLSYFKIILNKHKLDHVLFSTWASTGEDIFQIIDWYGGDFLRSSIYTSVR